MKLQPTTACAILVTMFSMQRAAAFTVRQAVTRRSMATSATVVKQAEKGQAEVILVGCGAPNRGASLCVCRFGLPSM
jgi:hypothetical protein